MLSIPVSKLTSIGPIYQKRLDKLGIHTVADLLYHFPFRYENYSHIVKTTTAKVGDTVTLIGQLIQIENIYTKNRKKITQAIIQDEKGSLSVIWFNQHFLTRILKKGMLVSLSGKVDRFNYKIVLLSPEYEGLKESIVNSQQSTERNKQSSVDRRQWTTIHTGRLVPIYPETARLSSKWLRSRLKPLLDKIKLTEYLPLDILNSEDFPGINEALFQIHFPESSSKANQARRRFAFEELFLLQLQNLIRRKSWQEQRQASAFEINSQKITSLIKSLPFELTQAQKKATQKIFNLLQKTQPTNCLLEGDVGSGKTVVACLASYLAYLNGFQTVFMAPTEVLAYQHYETITQIFKPFGLNIKLVTGSKKPPPEAPARRRGRDQPLAEKTGNQQTTDIFIGTHALLHHLDLFTNLGFVVIDEQHRFGVEQRALLSNLLSPKPKANSQRPTAIFPHVLTMTATPIPRSLALTFYGDLDLIILDEMPHGRQKIKTFVTPDEKRRKAYDWIQNQIINSHFQKQAFIIYPLIDESDVETMKDIKAATLESEKLKKILKELKIGLLHGRLKAREKAQTIKDFQAQKIQVLVSTSVVEVGIDIPSATIMVIENAERFGLAQLHQLRGRVGRGQEQSYCFLFTQSENPLTLKRLSSLEKEHCGFKLAEIDLQLRGPGEIFGTKQHGIPELKVASLTDVKLIEKTRSYAEKLITADPRLDRYPSLYDKLKETKNTQTVPN